MRVVSDESGFDESGFLMKLFFLMNMVLMKVVFTGGAAVETTSVPLKKLLLTAHCQRRLALHPCGDQVRFHDAGPTYAGS